MMHYLRYFLLVCGAASLFTGCADVPSDKMQPVFFDEYVLSPPFLKNKKFIVMQGFYGKKTHKDELNAYAVDIAIPYGEPVCAAKSGVVKSYNDADRPMLKNKRFREDNFVHILHPDMTWGVYAHLLPGSITVKPGQAVKQGECFARVGNTGYSTGPHLHFALIKRLQGRFVSVPFRFRQPDGQVVTPGYLEWVSN